MATKQDVLDAIKHDVSKFLYYDRKEDDDLPVGEIEQMVECGEITIDEMVETFRAALTKSCIN